MTPFNVQLCYFWANVYIASFADRLSICGSTDAITVMQIRAQEKQRNMVHHPTEKGPKRTFFANLMEVSRG